MKDSLLLFDDNERLKRIINSYEFFKDEYKVTTSGEVSLEFRIKDNITDINKGDKIGVFKDDETMDLLIVEQVESETSYSTEYKVTCLHDFYSLQEQKAITQYENKSVSLRDALTTMLDGTTYELGECPERTLKAIGPYLFKNVLWCIQDILQLFEVEVYYSIELDSTRTNIVKKKLNVVNALGSDTGIRCSTDLNVSKIKRIEKNKFYTVMYGCGATYQKDNIEYKYSFKDISWSTPNNPADKPLGLEYVEDKEAIAKYGRKIGIYEDGRIKDPNLLLKYTWEALRRNNKPFASYELELEELKNEDGYEHLDFKLGDLIILHNTIDDSRAKFRIVEDIRSISDRQKRKVVVGEQIRGLVSSGSNSNNGTLGPGGSVIPPSAEGDIKPPSIEEITPDTLPAVPVVTTKGLWKSVQLSWTYENKMYYDYEVYASKIKDFEPTVFHMIYSGKASAFLHEVGANETWYYRVRAVNTFGNATDFSQQAEATTTKVADGTEFFESAAIKDALIEELRLDRGWIGTLRGHYIDARQLSVTDGNGKRTFDIDSFGNVNLDVTNLKIASKSVPTSDNVIAKGEAIADINVTPGSAKIKANKIQLNGATTIGDGISRYVGINNGDYTLYENGKVRGFFGYKKLTDYDSDDIIPRLTLTHYGLDAKSNSYFTMFPYPADTNPQGTSYPYIDMCYCCPSFQRDDDKGGTVGDFSNIKMYGNGDMRLSPIKRLEITSNYINGAYPNPSSGYEKVIATFLSSASSYYDGCMEIPAIRRWGGNTGLILAHYNNNEVGTLVRVGTDSNNDKFFRPVTGEQDINNGSPSFRWKGIYTVNSVNASSDRRLKENVKYIEEVPNVRAATTDEITTKDMYDFVNNDLYIARYNFIGNDNNKYGFIAQDIVNTKVGSEIITCDRNSSDTLGYDTSNYTNVLAGALKEAINEIEKLKEEIKALKGGA
ncbi:hypothetical protein EAI30_13685 [Romboutsia ilealis]|uniref:Phage tail protein n=1 Tax=Romboutsia faecis TaxID=2764597 RepID=A0ABR7JST2_9FIRM|nr:phage tail spike protein [Romboutsia faecis]MBC5997978.1 phage tail protein [Romboutsia faecis]MRN25670.1 hypothetical protein [Romboutsia ilealis]